MFKYSFLAALLALVACAAEKEAPTADALPKVQLALNWFPEAEHGGLYAAAVHGYYEENGVEVEILGGGPDAPVVQRVATDAVAFGIVKCRRHPVRSRPTNPHSRAHGVLPDQPALHHGSREFGYRLHFAN